MMTRIACGLALVAFATLLHLIVDPGGPTASVYFFIGSPCLALAIALYVFESRSELRAALIRQLTMNRTSVEVSDVTEAAPPEEEVSS